MLGPAQSFAHGRRRHEERRRNPFCIQPEHRLQHQRRADAHLDGRMRAGEHQGQPAVRDRRVRRRGAQPLRQELHLRGCRLAPQVPSGDVDQLAARDGQEPRFRVGWAAL